MNASKKEGGVLKKRSKSPKTTFTPTRVSEMQHHVWECYRDRMKLANPVSIQKGQIWSTLMRPRHLKGMKPSSDTDSRLVLVLDHQLETMVFKEHEYDKILVAPISINTGLATGWDFIVDQDSSPLGYSFMVEIWNKTTMLTDSTARYLGKLDAGTLSLIGSLNLAHTQESLEETVVDWAVYGLNVGQLEVKPGNEVYKFQRSEVQAVDYLSAPVKHLVERSESRDEYQMEPRTIQKLSDWMQHPSLSTIVNTYHLTKIGTRV